MTIRAIIASSMRQAGLHAVVAVVVRAEERSRRLLRQGAWRLALTRYLLTRARPQVLTGQLDPSSIPIVMCLWTRTDRLPQIVDQLQAQVLDRPIRLILWNNLASRAPEYQRIIADSPVRGRLASIELFTSRRNIGGLARFVAARQLVTAGYTGPIITLDDDQNVSATFASDLLHSFQPGGIAGVWAFRTVTSYYNRAILSHGESANYVGTGGAVFDAELFRSRHLFTRLPARYGFLEDMWASHYAIQKGGALVKVDTPVEFVQSEHDQHPGLFDLKEEFYSYLQATKQQADLTARAKRRFRRPT